jgi:hypothetical protein
VQKEDALHFGELVGFDSSSWLQPVDASQPWTAECQSLADNWPSAIIVYNKSDLAVESHEKQPDGIFTSALYRRGID